ncbi:MAG: GNAT family N-acetyltransferase [Myxococcota bacterium]
MASTPFLQPATAQDLPLLLELSRELNTLEHIPFNPDEMRPLLRQLLADANVGRLWLLRVDDETAGYAMLTFGFDLEYRGRDAFITELFIRPPFRGRGLGTQALTLVLDAARNLGLSAVHLEVRPENGSAVRLYRNLGFKAHERITMTRWLT